jgi:hypothetical protein
MQTGASPESLDDCVGNRDARYTSACRHEIRISPPNHTQLSFKAAMYLFQFTIFQFWKVYGDSLISEW